MGTPGTSALGPAAIDWKATEPPMSELMKTPLNAAHRALNAKMVDFGGWDMPVQYPAGIIAEHEAVRTKAGLFDVSHMGEIRVKGPGALALVEQEGGTWKVRALWSLPTNGRHSLQEFQRQVTELRARFRIPAAIFPKNPE